MNAPSNNLKYLSVENANVTNDGIEHFVDLVKSQNCHLKAGKLKLDFQNCTAKVMREFIEINHPCLPQDIKLSVTSLEEAELIASSVKINDYIKTITINEYKLPLQMLRTEKKVVLKNENGIKLCKFDFALVVVLLTSNKNVKTVDLRNTYEVAEADELEQKDKVEITEFLCNLLMNKKKETNFDLKLEWNHLDIECILSFFKTKHDCLPTALDISTSNPESNCNI